MSYIDVQNLIFNYSDKDEVIKDISFSIEKGEWVSIIGHNGSGKSTLSKLIMGLLEPTKGKIFIDSKEVNEENLYEIRKKIGIVFQNPDNQFVGSNVEDDVAFGMENLSIPRDEMLRRIEYYLSKVNMLDYRLKEPSNLSGGQKQRVAIAGILAMSTDIIIFDEATSMLDPEGKHEIISLLKELHNEGITIITITHDMEEALYSNKIIVMKEGQILKSDITENVMKDEKVLLDAHLELPTTLKIYFDLLKQDYKNERILNALWELALKK